MRARQPDRTDVVERDGVKVAYEVAGAGEPGSECCFAEVKIQMEPPVS